MAEISSGFLFVYGDTHSLSSSQEPIVMYSISTPLYDMYVRRRTILDRWQDHDHIHAPRSEDEGQQAR